MEFLPQQNRRNEGDTEETLLANMKAASSILATGKHVIIIGGGDTGADCLGTSHRQGAKSVHQFEIMPKPPAERAAVHALAALAAATAHRKLARRRRHPRLEHQQRQIHRRRARQRQAASRVRVGPPPKFEAQPGTEFTLDVDLVLLAMGFLGPVRNGMIEQLGLTLDNRGNIATTNFMSSREGVFAAGDMRRGQSLVVWAISEGRKAAAAVNEYLAAKSEAHDHARRSAAVSAR